MAIIIFIILVFLDSLMYGYIYEHQILCREYGLGIFNWSEWRFLWWIKYDWWEWIFERSLIVISNSRKIIGLIRKKNYQSHNRNSIGNNKFLKVHKNTKSFLQTTNSNFDLINTEGLIQIYKAIKIVKEKIQILINEYHKKGVLDKYLNLEKNINKLISELERDCFRKETRRIKTLDTVKLSEVLIPDDDGSVSQTFNLSKYRKIPFS